MQCPVFLTLVWLRRGMKAILHPSCRPTSAYSQSRSPMPRALMSNLTPPSPAASQLPFVSSHLPHLSPHHPNHKNIPHLLLLAHCRRPFSAYPMHAGPKPWSWNALLHIRTWRNPSMHRCAVPKCSPSNERKGSTTC